MPRFEYKYILPVGMLEKMRAMIRPFMELDKYAKKSGGEYTVRSIYFDNNGLECYFQKLAGVKNRHKVRLRGYNRNEDSGLVFFEIKTKVGEPLVKSRASLDFEQALRLLDGGEVESAFHANGNNSTKALNNARQFLYYVHARHMFPVVTVIYEREAYQTLLKDDDNDLRITFDKNLRGVPYPSLQNLFDEKVTHPVDGRYFIMEVKFNRYLPAWARAIITSLGLKKGPASKYILCVDACPELQNHKRPGLQSLNTSRAKRKAPTPFFAGMRKKRST